MFYSFRRFGTNNYIPYYFHLFSFNYHNVDYFSPLSNGYCMLDYFFSYYNKYYICVNADTFVNTETSVYYHGIKNAKVVLRPDRNYLTDLLRRPKLFEMSCGMFYKKGIG